MTTTPDPSMPDDADDLTVAYMVGVSKGREAALRDAEARIAELQARLEAAEKEGRTLRRMLCRERAGTAAYMDDGEAQDNREHPSIDYLRDSLDEIAGKLMKRYHAHLAALKGTAA